jgi:hypothetical protein
MSGSHEVILSAQPGIEFDILKRSCNTQFGQLVRSHPGNPPVPEVDLTFLRFVKTIDAVKECRLTGPIRSDDSQYLLIPDVHADVGKGTDAAKAERKVVNPQLNLPIRFHRSSSPVQRVCGNIAKWSKYPSRFLDDLFRYIFDFQMFTINYFKNKSFVNE